MIPEQLKKEGVKFILIKSKAKIPLEKAWQKINNYSWDDEKLQAHIKNGGNYGVLCGKANLVVIDFDDEKTQNEVIPLIPKTFTVRTGSGLYHKYFLVDEMFKKMPIKDKNQKVLMDIQAEGSQVIAPGSIHPNGNQYVVVDDSEIASIKKKDLEEILKPYKHKIIEEVKKLAITKKDTVVDQIKHRIKVSELMSRVGFDISKNPTDCLWHSSKNKQSFSYDDSKGLWHCFHCGKAGDVINLYMECYPSCTFKDAKKDLADLAGIKFKVEKFAGGLKISNFIVNVEKFYELQPFFYDTARIFWLWNKEDFRWNKIDDVDILNSIEEELNFGGETVPSNIKNGYLEAFKRVGRRKIPKDTPKHWVQFKDKIYDLKNGDILKASKDYFITNPIPWDVGESMDTPVMDSIFGSWVDKEYVDTLYEILAFCCLPDYPLHRIFCLVGSGLNGKGKFLSLLSKFVGSDNKTSSDLDVLLRSRFECAKLYKKLVCLMGETNFDGLSRTGLLKRLSGQDLVGFEFKQKNPIDEINYAKLIIATNSLPTTTDKTIGFYRRWMIIDFPNSFNEKKDILEDIPEEEYNNLAKKCLFLLKDLLKVREFTNEGSIADRMKKYEDKSNPLAKFLKDNTQNNSDSFVYKFDFRDNFIGWLQQNGYRVWTEKEIGLEMKNLYDDGRRQADYDYNKYIRAWLGLKWKEKESV